ncbi:DNA methyltransferase [Hephaestia sp. GCM10023244]|uniref:DNA methyltransferase n=1 Tax=unclassified Hephaestia TaxID=2631281 RepID=UPI0020770707|nr:DNA methyltransferase [Hephaestia sp. MAHUQ-44]MCM8729572.1 restriction endonuclease [Hephaestia sp. MAHUQ-44]
MQPTNHLFYGDNLDVLRAHVPDASVDLIYLDPPFNSNANYNILFKSPEGRQSESQIEAFEDTWHWNDRAERAFDEVMRSGNTGAFTLLRAMREFLGDNDMMAYLAMMAVRLIELHRALKPTGSLYLHCDPTASHYLKLLLDGVFGATNYVNEIVWKRSDAKNDAGQGAKHFGRVNDIILFYQKTNDRIWNALYEPLSDEYVRKFYKYRDADGRRWKMDNMLGPGGAAKGNPYYEVMGVSRHWRYSRERMQQLIDEGRVVQTKPGNVPMYKRYLDESKGTQVTTNWSDISMLRGWSGEKMPYPTQKPLALLERIISASSDEGGVVLDPFCGCGTAVHAAQKLGRRWIGIDVTHLAIGLIEKRMTEAFPGIAFEVVGRPQSLASARDLARRDKHQFELWALSVVEADPWKGGRKGPDGGIDGIIWFKPDGRKTEKAIVEVKGGGTGVKDVGRLAQVIQRENAKIGVLITAQMPTRAMERDAAAVGVWANEYTGRKHGRLQIITLAELFQNKRPDIPWVDTTVGRQARREESAKQGSLL